MSLESVTEDIKEQARARAEEIRSEAEAEAEEIISEAEAEAEEIREQRERDVERQIQQEREQRLSSGNLEAKQTKLAARRRLLERVREEVEEAILNFEEDTREELTRELLDAAAEEVDDGTSVSVYGRAEQEVASSRVGSRTLLKEILDDYDGFSYAGEYDCLGGVVIESEESRVRLNLTFDAILDDVWQESLREISAKLFDEEQ
ncbi:MAG: V-type ATP synthase subunit E [Halapricum sp.]